MTTVAKSPFPKLSQLWRFIRIGGVGVASAAVTDLAHLVWSDRTVIAVGAVAAVEVAYRQAFPSGKLAGQLASLVAAYRQITAAKPPAPPVQEPPPAV